MFKTYKSRPDTVDAIHITPDNADTVAAWLATHHTNKPVKVLIRTPESEFRGRDRIEFTPTGTISDRRIMAPIPGYLYRRTENSAVLWHATSVESFDDQYEPIHPDDTPNAPAQYRDRDGDLWERTSPFMYALADGDTTGEAIFSRPLRYVSDTYGPLTPHKQALSTDRRCCGATIDPGDGRNTYTCPRTPGHTEPCGRN